MTNRTKLIDEEWQTIYSLLKLNQRVYAEPEETSHLFLNAVLWVLRSDCQ